MRRALANVPTYIGDGHEITDDLYSCRAWRDTVFTPTLGVDVLRHGLTAYMLMQAGATTRAGGRAVPSARPQT